MSRLSTLLLLLGTTACAAPGEVPAWVDGPSAALLKVEADLGVARAMLGNALRTVDFEPAATNVLRTGRRKRRAHVTATPVTAGAAPLQFELVEKRSPGRPVLTTISLVGDHVVPPAPARPLRGGEAARVLEAALRVATGQVLAWTASQDPVEQLRRHLDGKRPRLALADADWASLPLTRRQAERAAVLLWDDHAAHVRATRRESFDKRVVDNWYLRMAFSFTTFGEPGKGGRSAWISMHGGGNATSAVNDGQWENQKRLYKPREGVYLAPRAPTDTWNLWHQSHIDPMFDALITDLVVFEGVDPDRVYLMGYSAGGDGVYQLAPRMADRFAAAAMMAGHPNETRPDGLRNLPFTLHVGGEDAAYDRNEVGRKWGVNLAALRAKDPGGYEHWVEIHEGKGHWMDGQDAAALPWMAKHTRDLRPDRVVWLQDDVLHRRFYWLAVDEPAARSRIVVERVGQEFRFAESTGVKRVILRLDDVMCRLDRPVTVRWKDEVLFRGVVPRTVATLARTLEERGDPSGIWSAEVVVDLPLGGD